LKGIYEINEFNGIFLQRVLNLLRKLDTTKVFYEPVDAIATPNYYDRIKQPMDFSKMQKKVTGMEYESVADLEADFNLMIQNCIAVLCIMFSFDCVQCKVVLFEGNTDIETGEEFHRAERS